MHPDRTGAVTRSTARLLVTACPLFGHVNTVLPLAVAARRAGFDVVVATGADMAAHVERRGLTAWPVGPTQAEAGVPDSPRWFARTGADRAADLLPLAAAWRPDLVVHEETELAGLLVAARLGARHVAHGLGIAATGSWEQFAPVVEEAGERAGVPDLPARLRAAEFLSLCPPALRPDEPDRPAQRALRPAFGQAAPGDALPAAMAGLPHPRTAHLTLGTVFHHSDVLGTAIAGLRDLPVNLVVTVGPDVDPDRFGPQPPHVLVERYVPHGLLLPRCDLVVSQGGAGVLLGALAHGLPQLVLPQAADQPANAEAVRRAGAGLVLHDGQVSADSVRGAAVQLLDRPRHRAAARAVAAEIAAMPAVEEVVAALLPAAAAR
jgi:UDP:flavonoid glycosyltransferase YjiC (YdhE family)